MARCAGSPGPAPRWSSSSCCGFTRGSPLPHHARIPARSAAKPAPEGPDEQSTGYLDIGRAYGQWAGHPAGLLLEVGDAATHGGPLAAPWATHLGWLGWQPPDSRRNDNAWFEAENPGAVELASDLIVRTREAVLSLVEQVHELTAEDLGLTADEPTAAHESEPVARDLPELTAEDLG